MRPARDGCNRRMRFEQLELRKKTTRGEPSFVGAEFVSKVGAFPNGRRGRGGRNLN